MYTLHVISLEFTRNPHKFYRDITKNYVITWFPRNWYMISLHLIREDCLVLSDLMWGIPVNQIPFKYYNGNENVGISKLQGLQVTCNPRKFEIPELWFPYKDTVNPCKHLQCVSINCQVNKRHDQSVRMCQNVCKLLEVSL